MNPQLQLILEADEGQLEELVKKAANKASPPNLQQLMAMLAQGAQGASAQPGLSPLLSTPPQMPNAPQGGLSSLLGGQ